MNEQAAARERARERAIQLQRKRRQSMTIEQKQSTNLRRCKTYHSRKAAIENVPKEKELLTVANAHQSDFIDQNLNSCRKRRNDPRILYNVARNLREKTGFKPFTLKNPIICKYCRAKLFQGEERTFCCKRGKIKLSEIPVPPESLNYYLLNSLLKGENSEKIYALTITSSHLHPCSRPRYIQMFIYDTEHETENRLLESNGLNRDMIDRIIDVSNPFVQTLRYMAQHPDFLESKLLIKERPSTERQYMLPSSSQVAAIISAEDVVVSHLHPCGTYGWDSNICTTSNTRVTCCDYYAYMLQIRDDGSILLHGGRRLQLYVVDNHVKIETQKLRYILTHQDTIRAELYKGLQDCLQAGEIDAGNVGRRTILPSSFIGSERDKYQRYQDGMAVVQHSGKPDIFITMTCNPKWQEIQNELLPGQNAQDRPDLLTRIFVLNMRS